MTNYTPGTFVHYRQSGSQDPYWPAVVCTDDVAPESFLRTRPAGYVDVTVVLRMGQKLDFQWARTPEMSDYNPFVPFEEEEKVASTPGLGDAYEMASNALEAGLNLDYWREQVRRPVIVDSDSEITEISSEDEACSDIELREAMRASRQAYYGKRSKKASRKRWATLPTPSLSPRERVRNSGSGFAATGTKSVHTSSLFRSSTAASSTFAPGPSGHIRKRENLRTPPLSHQHRLSSRGSNGTIDLTEESDATTLTDQKTTNFKPFQPSSSFLDKTLESLHRSFGAPTSDTVDGELGDSKEFIQFLVGPNANVYFLPLKSVSDRSYFKDRGYGVNLFVRNAEGIWELDHPSLSEIQPEDFAFVAQYFESDDFGHKHPRGEEETDDAYAQCIAAWEAAKKLGMSDLMDHIVAKVKRFDTPGLLGTLAFAIEVYRSADTEPAPCMEMKDYLATYIAQHWWIYIEEDHLNTDFIKVLKALPELEMDIYARRLAALDERVHGDDDDDDVEVD